MGLLEWSDGELDASYPTRMMLILVDRTHHRWSFCRQTRLAKLLVDLDGHFSLHAGLDLV